MLQEFFHPVITYLHHHPHSAGLITFTIAFCEALAVIGTIIPGSVTMTAIGILVGSAVIPATATLLCAIGGAICGDFASYGAGLYYKDRIHKIWPFTRYPHWLSKGERFFFKHGGKSVIIGRFFGPARSMVPLIAGTLRMRPLRFLIAAVPSASVWAVGYMIPGILLGALSVELPPGLALKVIVIILAGLLILALVTWIIKSIYCRFTAKVEKETKRIWRYMHTHKATHWLTRLLTSPNYLKNHHQLILTIYAGIYSLLFLVIMVSALTHGSLTILNEPIYHLLRNLRAPLIDKVMLSLTILGSKQVLLTSSLLFFIWLCFKRYWRAAWHWAAVTISAGIIIKLLKILFYSTRPNQLLNGPITSSFPSGHSCLAVSLSGFLAVLIATQISTENRRIPYIIALVISLAIMFSRIFLGAHWLTDVIGGGLLGLIIVMLATISYRRNIIPYTSWRKITASALIIVAIVWLGDSLYGFKKLQHDYTPTWPKYTISMQQWLNRSEKHIPLYRINRLGHPVEAFNIEWLGNLTTISNHLIKHGWTPHNPSLTAKSIIYRLATTSKKHRLPLLPQLYQKKTPALLLTKLINDRSVILRLWPANFSIKDHIVSVWLGVINYYRSPDKLLLNHKHNTIRKSFLGATKELVPYLKPYFWKRFTYPTDKQPKIMQKLHWNGELLLIKNK